MICICYRLSSSGFFSRPISSSLTTLSFVVSKNASQSTQVCTDSLTLNIGKWAVGCQTNVVSEVSGWHIDACLRSSIQWSWFISNVNIKAGSRELNKPTWPLSFFDSSSVLLHSLALSNECRSIFYTSVSQHLLVANADMPTKTYHAMQTVKYAKPAQITAFFRQAHTGLIRAS